MSQLALVESGGKRREVAVGGFVRRTLTLVALFLMVVVPAGGIALSGHFDGLYGQDPYAYLDYATGPLAESLSHFSPPPPFYWPPGYPLALDLASVVVGSGPLAGQIVSLIAGGLVPVFTALLAGEVWSEGIEGQPVVDRESRRAVTAVTLVAGLASALAGQVWQSSVVVMADTTGLALACLGVWALVRYHHGGRAGWLILAASALAGAVLTRWAYALVAIPAATYAGWTLTKLSRRQMIAHSGIGLIVVGLILGPMLISALSGLLRGGSDIAPFATDLQVYSWSPLNLTRRTFLTADGVLSYRLPNGLFYALAPARPYFFTPLLAWLIIPGLWSIARRRTSSELLIVSWAIMIFAFHAGAPWQNFRFTLAFLPPLAVVVGFGAVVVGRQSQRFARGIPRAAFPVLLAIAMGWQIVSGISLTRGFVERKDADLATAQWLRARLPPNAILLTFDFTLTARHYTSVETVDLSETTPSDITDLLTQGRPVFLFVDLDNIETQWQGRSPSTNYHWLRDGPGVDRVDRSQNYTLLRIRVPAGISARNGSGGLQ